jgi:hypothetical protein
MTGAGPWCLAYPLDDPGPIVPRYTHHPCHDGDHMARTGWGPNITWPNETEEAA